MQLYKTTIIVWSDCSTDNLEIEHICREATDGAFICSDQVCAPVEVEVADEDDWFSSVPGGSEDKDAERVLEDRLAALLEVWLSRLREYELHDDLQGGVIQRCISELMNACGLDVEDA